MRKSPTPYSCASGLTRSGNSKQTGYLLNSVLQLSDSVPAPPRLAGQVQRVFEPPVFEPPNLKEHKGDLRNALKYWEMQNGVSTLKLQRLIFFSAVPDPSESISTLAFNDPDLGTKMLEHRLQGHRVLALSTEDGPLNLKYLSM
jgi:hypothetical protein